MKSRKTKRRHLASAAAVVLCAVVLAGSCRRSPSGVGVRLTTLSGPTMGTHYTVKIAEPCCSPSAETLKEEIECELERIDTLMSTYRPGSELSRLNLSDIMDWFTVSPETAVVLEEAVRVGHLTGGAFDVTVGPLVKLWNFGPEKEPADRVPSADEIEKARAKTGFCNIRLRPSPAAVRKEQPGLHIDLSGIAKGFAVDRLAELLEHRGIVNYMIDIGGELNARGFNQRGRPWRIAIESPLPGAGKIQKVIALDGIGLATSGDYRNYFERDGVRYSHIIDPRSGRPIRHNLASVSVLAPSCMTADALATGLMVLGPDAGYELARREHLPALFVIKTEGRLVEKMTPEFQATLRLQ